MKKVIALFQKYICGRVDIYEWERGTLLPLIQYGKAFMHEGRWYGTHVQIAIPSFQFGFENEPWRRMDIAAWRVPVWRWIKARDAKRGTSYWSIDIWEEDNQRTLDEEVRRRNKLNDGFIYSHDNKYISCIGPGIIRGIATEHLQAGQAVYLDPNNPGRAIACGTGQGV